MQLMIRSWYACLKLTLVEQGHFQQFHQQYLLHATCLHFEVKCAEIKHTKHFPWYSKDNSASQPLSLAPILVNWISCDVVIFQNKNRLKYKFLTLKNSYHVLHENACWLLNFGVQQHVEKGVALCSRHNLYRTDHIQNDKQCIADWQYWRLGFFRFKVLF